MIHLGMDSKVRKKPPALANFQIHATGELLVTEYGQWLNLAGGCFGNKSKVNRKV